jgi:hypothetical protein
VRGRLDVMKITPVSPKPDYIGGRPSAGYWPGNVCPKGKIRRILLEKGRKVPSKSQKKAKMACPLADSSDNTLPKMQSR